VADVNLTAHITAHSALSGNLSGVQVPLSCSISAAAALSAWLTVPDAPAFRRGIRMIAPGGRHFLRRIPFDWIRVGEPYSETVEIAAEVALTAPRLWTDRTGWMRVSIDGGGFESVGDSWDSGVELGAFTEGERITVVIEILVPVGTVIRSEFLPVNLGIGTEF
jgi:hypothetical protein